MMIVAIDALFAWNWQNNTRFRMQIVCDYIAVESTRCTNRQSVDVCRGTDVLYCLRIDSFSLMLVGPSTRHPFTFYTVEL